MVSGLIGRREPLKPLELWGAEFDLVVLNDAVPEHSSGYLLLEDPATALEFAHPRRLLDTVRTVRREWWLGVSVA
ncbi:hypothetical protein WT24_16240 [Burkholderia sp. MSMB1078WGS]|nr:hypothetical protein WT24_16240 [Burkholderia sp. MSMB1078WGS]